MSLGTHKDGSAGLSASRRWGAIDKSGTMVISPQFNYPLDFHEGLAAVNKGGKQENYIVPVGGKWGFVDKTGKMVIQPRFDMAGPFSEGLALVNLGGRFHQGTRDEGQSPYHYFRDGKWGFVDPKGKLVIQPIFDKAFRFSEGLASVEVKDKWGCIDKTGKFIISPKFGFISYFCKGLAPVINFNGDTGISESGYVDRTGKLVVKLDGLLPDVFSEGLARVGKGTGKNRFFGFVDKTGRIVIPPRFKQVWPFHNGLARVMIDGKVGYIDKTGNYVWEPAKQSIRPKNSIGGEK